MARFTCSACGQEWDKHPFLQLPCPTCDAPAGAWCRRPSEHSGPFVEIHVAREQAVVDAGLVDICPAAKKKKIVKQTKVTGQMALPIQI